MASVFRRHRRAWILGLMLIPSVLFASSYVAGAVSGPKYLHYSQSSGPWGFNMTVSQPLYAVSGGQVSVTVKVGVQDTNSTYTVEVNDVGVEMRQPLVINSTSGVVTGWAVLNSARTTVDRNYTGSAAVTAVLTLVASAPPSGGAGELFVPTSGVAYNGVADLTVYQGAGNQSSASAVPVSLIDSVTYYQTELSTVASSSSWVTYQLLAGLAAVVVLNLTRPHPLAPSATPYSLELRRFKAERMLARLEELRRSGKIGIPRYDELKQRYKRELGGAGT